MSRVWMPTPAAMVTVTSNLRDADHTNCWRHRYGCRA
jgi:hypothetical protein